MSTAAEDSAYLQSVLKQNQENQQNLARMASERSLYEESVPIHRNDASIQSAQTGFDAVALNRQYYDFYRDDPNRKVGVANALGGGGGGGKGGGKGGSTLDTETGLFTSTGNLSAVGGIAAASGGLGGAGTVGSPAWYDSQIQLRTQAALANTAANPTQPNSPLYQYTVTYDHAAMDNAMKAMPSVSAPLTFGQAETLSKISAQPGIGNEMMQQYYGLTPTNMAAINAFAAMPASIVIGQNANQLAVTPHQLASAGISPDVKQLTPQQYMAVFAQQQSQQPSPQPLQQGNSWLDNAATMASASILQGVGNWLAKINPEAPQRIANGAAAVLGGIDTIISAVAAAPQAVVNKSWYSSAPGLSSVFNVGSEVQAGNLPYGMSSIITPSAAKSAVEYMGEQGRAEMRANDSITAFTKANLPSNAKLEAFNAEVAANQNTLTDPFMYIPYVGQANLGISALNSVMGTTAPTPEQIGARVGTGYIRQFRDNPVQEAGLFALTYVLTSGMGNVLPAVVGEDTAAALRTGSASKYIFGTVDSMPSVAALTPAKQAVLAESGIVSRPFNIPTLLLETAMGSLYAKSAVESVSGGSVEIGGRFNIAPLGSPTPKHTDTYALPGLATISPSKVPTWEYSAEKSGGVLADISAGVGGAVVGNTYNVGYLGNMVFSPSGSMVNVKPDAAFSDLSTIAARKVAGTDHITFFQDVASSTKDFASTIQNPEVYNNARTMLIDTIPEKGMEVVSNFAMSVPGRLGYGVETPPEITRSVISEQTALRWGTIAHEGTYNPTEAFVNRIQAGLDTQVNPEIYRHHISEQTALRWGTIANRNSYNPTVELTNYISNRMGVGATPQLEPFRPFRSEATVLRWGMLANEGSWNPFMDLRDYGTTSINQHVTLESQWSLVGGESQAQRISNRVYAGSYNPMVELQKSTYQTLGIGQAPPKEIGRNFVTESMANGLVSSYGQPRSILATAYDKYMGLVERIPVSNSDLKTFDEARTFMLDIFPERAATTVGNVKAELTNPNFPLNYIDAVRDRIYDEVAPNVAARIGQTPEQLDMALTRMKPTPEYIYVPGGTGYEYGYPVGGAYARNVKAVNEAFFSQGLTPAPVDSLVTRVNGHNEHLPPEYIPKHVTFPGESEDKYYALTAWEHMATMAGKGVGDVFELGEGASPPFKGAFAAPVIEGYFLKLPQGIGDMSDFSLFGRSVGSVKSPVIIRWSFESMEEVPSEIRSQGQLAVSRWIETRGNPGALQILGQKAEIEGLVPYTASGQRGIGTIMAIDKYVEIGNYKIPIYDVAFGTRPVEMIENAPTAGARAIPTGLNETDTRAINNLKIIATNLKQLEPLKYDKLDLGIVKGVGEKYAPAITRAIAEFGGNEPTIVYGGAANTGVMTKSQMYDALGRITSDVDASQFDALGQAKNIEKVLPNGRLEFIWSRESNDLFGIKVLNKEGGSWVEVADIHSPKVSMRPSMFQPEGQTVITEHGIHYTDLPSQVYNLMDAVAGREVNGKWEIGARPSRAIKDTTGMYGNMKFILEQQANQDVEAVLNIRNAMRDLREHPNVGKYLGEKDYRYGKGDKFFSGFDLTDYYNPEKPGLVNPIALGAMSLMASDTSLAQSASLSSVPSQYGMYSLYSAGTPSVASPSDFSALTGYNPYAVEESGLPFKPLSYSDYANSLSPVSYAGISNTAPSYIRPITYEPMYYGEESYRGESYGGESYWGQSYGGNYYGGNYYGGKYYNPSYYGWDYYNPKIITTVITPPVIPPFYNDMFYRFKSKKPGKGVFREVSPIWTPNEISGIAKVPGQRKMYPTVKVPLHDIEESYRGVQYNVMADMTGVGKAARVAVRHSRQQANQPREFNAADAAGFSQPHRTKIARRHTINSSKSNNWIARLLK